MNQTQPVVIVTPCSVSLAIRQSPSRTGHLNQHWKPPRFKLVGILMSKDYFLGHVFS